MENIIEVMEEVKIGNTILEPGDKFVILEDSDIYELAKSVANTLMNNRCRFKKIGYSKNFNSVSVVLGMNYSDDAMNKCYDVLEDAGFKKELNNDVIEFVGDVSGADVKFI